MCCASCKVPKFPVVKRISRTRLRDEENRPANDVPRDMYGKPLKAPVLKTAAVQSGDEIGKTR
ncbi:MAG: hypothetical protein Pg6C_18540 [Treponemataceae bacterium]|nr:MAG: hypothetical protein Pg6C_18540 [Treponemataceae bacterium]